MVGHYKQSRRSATGSVAVEMALILPLFLILLMAREGCRCPKKTWLANPHRATHAFLSPTGVAADVRANDQTSAF